MGNIPSRQSLAVVAMSKYLHLTRVQVIALRNCFVTLADDCGMITRNRFRISLSRVKIDHENDVDVLDLLFTMWDAKGEDKVPYCEYIVGVSILAGPFDHLRDALAFAMEVADVAHTRDINAKQLIIILKCKEQTVFFRWNWNEMIEQTSQ